MSAITPPPNVNESVPDKYTQQSPDYSGDDYAKNRYLHVRTRLFNYGTDDKTQAAAIVLSVMILVVALIIVTLGSVVSISGREAKWLETVLT